MLHAAQFAQLQNAHLKELEEKFSQLWTHCQHCQGNFQEEVLCEVCNYVAIVIAIYVMKYNYYEWRHCMNKMHIH